MNLRPPLSWNRHEFVQKWAFAHDLKTGYMERDLDSLIEHEISRAKHHETFAKYREQIKDTMEIKPTTGGGVQYYAGKQDNQPFKYMTMNQKERREEITKFAKECGIYNVYNTQGTIEFMIERWEKWKQTPRPPSIKDLELRIAILELMLAKQ